MNNEMETMEFKLSSNDQTLTTTNFCKQIINSQEILNHFWNSFVETVYARECSSFCKLT